MRALWRFVWDFVVGDDWVPAAGIVILLGVTAFLVHGDHRNAWWLPPVAVVGLLSVSVGRATPRPLRAARAARSARRRRGA